MSAAAGPPPPERPEDDRIVAAAEIALGLRPDVGRNLRTDAELARDVERWREDFAKLADDLAPVPPRPRVWAALHREIAATPRPDARHWLESLWVWRALSGVGLATACALALLLVLPRGAGTPPPVTRVLLVSALLPKDGPPLFTATYDPSRRTFIIVPAAVPREPGRTVQLWVVPNDTDDPVALTSLNEDRLTVMTVSAAQAAVINRNAGLVVTSEPAGGGAASGPGPVLAHGRFESL